jgi:tetratricopeptide (TPR) repeat protein
MSMNGETVGAPRMRTESVAVGALAIAAMVGLSACSKVANLKGIMAYKEANKAYQVQDYKRAAKLYEEALQADPNQPVIYFYLGNSYDNLYKPGVQDPVNDALLPKAVQNYELAAEKLSKPEDVKLQKLDLQYLVAAYGPDKLNDPVKAEPAVQRLIRLDPADPANYFALAKIYEDAGVYDEAEKVLGMAKDAKPGDPAVYMTLAGYYNRQGQFDKTIAALKERAAKEPNNPEAFYTLATYYWDEAYRDIKLKDSEKKAYVEAGMEAIDHSLSIKPDYVEALVYKNLLLRLQANLEKDPAKQQALLKQADQFRDKAQDLRKTKASGVTP